MSTDLFEILGMGIIWLLMIIGILGIIVPLLPGILLIWLGVLAYVIVYGFELVSVPYFVLITIIALVTGTADLWLPLLGAKSTGVSWKTLGLGVAGAIAGTFLVPIVGTIIGYALGILLGEYIRLGEWRPAVNSSVVGMISWGVGTVVQLIGGVLIIFLFARVII